MKSADNLFDKHRKQSYKTQRFRAFTENIVAFIAAQN